MSELLVLSRIALFMERELYITPCNCRTICIYFFTAQKANIYITNKNAAPKPESQYLRLKWKYSLKFILNFWSAINHRGEVSWLVLTLYLHTY